MPLSRQSVSFVAAVAGAVVLAAVPSRAAAQLYVAVGANATYQTMGSADFEYPGAGFGIAGQVRVGQGWLSIGVGGMAMNFPVEAQPGDFDLTGFFLEPRVTVEGLDPDRQFTPYAFGRMAWLSQEGAVDRTPLTGEARLAGGGVGVLLRITPLIALDVGGSYSSMNLTERTFDSDSRPDESGGGFGAHVGAYLRFGAVPEEALRRSGPPGRSSR